MGSFTSNPIYNFSAELCFLGGSTPEKRERTSRCSWRGSRDGDILVTDTHDRVMIVPSAGFRRTFGHGRFKVQCVVPSKCGRGRLRPGKGKEETAHWARTTDGRAGRARSAASRIEGCRIARPPTEWARWGEQSLLVVAGRTTVNYA